MNSTPTRKTKKREPFRIEHSSNFTSIKPGDEIHLIRIIDDGGLITIYRCGERMFCRYATSFDDKALCPFIRSYEDFFQFVRVLAATHGLGFKSVDNKSESSFRFTESMDISKSLSHIR